MEKTLLAAAFILGLSGAGVMAAAGDEKAVNALFLAAGTAEQNNDPDGAIRAYGQILLLRPDDEAVLLDRGGAYMDKKDFAHAEADFTRALKLRPNDARAFADRGLVYLNTKKYDAALGDFTAAIKINPAYGEALNDRGAAYDFSHDFAHAIADYDAVIKLDPDEPDALNARCWDRAYLDRDLDAALADCTRALGLVQDRGTMAAIRDSRGFVYFRKGDMRAAIADYDLALRLEPKMAETFYKRGLAKNRSGDAGGGKADIAAALKLDPHAGDDMNEIGLKP